MNTTRKPIVVVGSVTMDLVASAPQLPRIGQTLIGTAFRTTPGGKGANQAVAAARLGYPVAMVAKVGDDHYGPTLLRSLASVGVQINAMEEVSGSSGIASIFLADSSENSIIVIPGANGKMDRAMIDAHAATIRSAGMVLCQFEIPMDTLAYTLELCADAGVPVMLDPAPAAPFPDAAWKQIAWFTPNETEAAFYLRGSAKAEEAASELLERGLGGVVLKRGAEGSYVAIPGNAAWVPPFPVQAIDTVAAGDCFNGAFAVALLEGRDPWQAARFANAAAAICVTRRGAQAAMPTRPEVEALLAAHA